MGRFFIAVIILLGILYGFYSFATIEPLGFQSGESSGYFKIIISAMAMIIGIIFGAIHRSWSLRKSPVTLSSVKAVLRSAELWRAMLLSPIVFSGVYVAAQDQPDYVLAFVVAFQSGFFCESVLKGHEEGDA